MSDANEEIRAWILDLDKAQYERQARDLKEKGVPPKITNPRSPQSMREREIVDILTDPIKLPALENYVNSLGLDNLNDAAAWFYKTLLEIAKERASDVR